MGAGFGGTMVRSGSRTGVDPLPCTDNEQGLLLVRQNSAAVGGRRTAENPRISLVGDRWYREDHTVDSPAFTIARTHVEIAPSILIRWPSMQKESGEKIGISENV